MIRTTHPIQNAAPCSVKGLGAVLEALGKAMQDGNTTVARLVELADAAGLRLAFRVDGE